MGHCNIYHCAREVLEKCLAGVCQRAVMFRSHLCLSALLSSVHLRLGRDWGTVTLWWWERERERPSWDTARHCPWRPLRTSAPVRMSRNTLTSLSVCLRSPVAWQFCQSCWQYQGFFFFILLIYYFGHFFSLAVCYILSHCVSSDCQCGTFWVASVALSVS